MPRRLLWLLALTAIAAPGPFLAGAEAQGQRPTFRAGVEYVEVDARVVDGKGLPVRHLTKDDFTLLEDGKEQAISSFSAVDIPANGSAADATVNTMVVEGRRVEPDVSQNQYRAEESRVFVLLLDDRQIAAERTQTTLRIVRDFVARIGPRDLAAIVSSSGRTDASQALTGNKTLLLEAGERVMGQKLESGVILAYNKMKPQSYESEQTFEARQSLKALSSVVSWMAGMQGRSKVLILVSEGLDYDVELSATNGPSGADSLPREELQTLADAMRGNVTIHPIDPRGLYAYDELTSLGNSYAAGLADATAGARQRETGAAAGDRSAPGLDLASATARAFKAEVNRAQLSLRSIAAETGGIATVNSNKFEEAFDAIVAQHSTYYLLGYQTSNTRQDGKLRKIDVRVKGRGLKVIARRGYREERANAPAARPAAPPAGASLALWNALNSPLPLGDLPMTAAAAVFRGQNGKGSVAVVVESPPDGFTLVERGGRFTGAVQVIAAAIDRRNGVAAVENNRVDLELGDETFARFERSGFRAVTTLRDLSAGPYQVRVALAPDGAQQGGSVWIDIEVPDFSKGTLAMSGLLIGSTGTSATPTAHVGDLFADVLQIAPAAVRQFKASDDLMVFAEVYGDRLAASAGADIAVILRDAQSREVLRRGDVITAERFEMDGGTYPFQWVVPLNTVSAGDYVLSVEATSPHAEPETLVRAVPIRIVP